MRIAYVLTSLGIGGAERQVLALAERMKARGHTVLLLVLRERQPEEWPAQIDLARLEMRKTLASVAAGLAKGAHILRGFDPDLIHSHTYPANMAARLLKILIPQAAVISTIHNVYEGSWPRMLAYRLTGFLSFHTTAVSQAAAERFVRLKAVSAGKTSVITNGIDTVEFTPTPDRRAHLRSEMGISGEFVWFTAGRIAPAKDYPNLLQAFAQAWASFPAAQLWIAGSGRDEASARIQAQAAELGVHVRWLGLRRDMPALLDAADGFVLASAWEGMPLAVGEAMAMEKPVAATDVGGVRELVGDAGLIVPAKNSEALASAMVKIMQSTPEERCSLGRSARARIANQFSMEAKAGEWEALYREVLAKKR
ncbi:MAG: glycosyltransferase [Terracidiphilus sp.]|jgi:glycosyltransferase involved in cell wall biosynthesis